MAQQASPTEAAMARCSRQQPLAQPGIVVITSSNPEKPPIIRG